MIVVNDRPVKIGRGVLFLGILMILAGVFVCFNPDTVLMAMALWLGVLFLMGGVGYLSAFATFKTGGLLALGLLDSLVGLILVSNLGVTAVTFPILLAVWVLCVGIIQIAFGVDAKAAGLASWKWTLGSGILGVLAGLLMLAHPMIGAFAISFVLGGYFILYGAMSIAEYRALKEFSR